MSIIHYQLKKKLPASFYLQEDVVRVSRDLLGKYLVSNIEGEVTAGMIVETEAYRGPDDRACHAWNYRYTDRTKVMFTEGGKAYIYLCYGIHNLFNVVTAGEGMPHAVLIRAIEPTDNIPLMLARRNFTTLKSNLTKGPGALTVALGLTKLQNGVNLNDPSSPVWIEDRGMIIPEKDVVVTTRVGVESAGESALLHWRFYVDPSPYVSRRLPKLKRLSHKEL